MKKTIMITGATSGFGRAIALKYALSGCNLIITGRRKEMLEDVEKEIKSISKSAVLCLNFDVRNRENVETIINDLPGEWKNIDVLVNNAGLAAGLSHIDKGDVDDWERMIDTNIKGLLYITKAVSPLMVKRKKGHIINIGSIAGIQPYENGNVYCATKAAVDSLSKSMRIDLLKDNIRVTNIAPGMAETEFSIVRFRGDKEKANAVYNGFKPIQAEELAEIIYFCSSLPDHICINDLVVTPTQQANAYYTNRNDS
ncbi:MAG TPA: SDR family NAD(P)-dependent oxidoreductase [Bacteroidales bacterium]|nr:SDR family NAD(P)-dependent oxidoreductase [Bacteroidales bacterium]